MTPSKFGFSQGLARKEDDVLIRGAGRYVADFLPARTLHAVVLRSPHAHARFRITDLEAARAVKGVHLVLTAEDVADLGGLPCVGIPEGVAVNAPSYPILARDEVRHVGDAIAFVVAETAAQAKDAAEAIAVDWEPLGHVVSAVEALKPGAPLVWPSHSGNVAFQDKLGDEKGTAEALASAAKTVTLPSLTSGWSPIISTPAASLRSTTPRPTASRSRWGARARTCCAISSAARC